MKHLGLAVVALLALQVGACGQPSGQSNQAQSLTVVSFGGPYQEAQRAAYMQPFSADAGIVITEGEYNGEYGLMALRARASQGAWDVVSVESGPALRGEREGIFQPLPESLLDGLNIAPAARRRSSVGHLSFATILAYPTAPGSRAPTSWADFWDLRRFPGRRGLRNNPRGTLEIALLADGVPADRLYPLDVDRALAKLDQIRSQIVFWDSGAQPVQLLANRAVVMTSAFNGRIWTARNVDHLPVGWTFNGGLYEYEFWAVLRNSRNPQGAFRFIRYSLGREPQANFANRIAYLPTNLDALALIRPEVRSAMPSGAQRGGEIIVDASWWAQHEAEVSAKWERWRSAR